MDHNLFVYGRCSASGMTSTLKAKKKTRRRRRMLRPCGSILWYPPCTALPPYPRRISQNNPRQTVSKAQNFRHTVAQVTKQGAPLGPYSRTMPRALWKS